MKVLERPVESDDAGVSMAATEDGREVCVTGHPELDRLTLNAEYDRDVGRGLPIAAPARTPGPRDRSSGNPACRARGQPPPRRVLPAAGGRTSGTPRAGLHLPASLVLGISCAPIPMAVFLSTPVIRRTNEETVLLAGLPGCADCANVCDTGSCRARCLAVESGRTSVR